MISFKNFISNTMSFIAKDYESVPKSLNGIEFNSVSHTAWASTSQINDNFGEIVNPHNMKIATGCIIQESDKRVWIVHPTNGFGGYNATFPKGKLEPELSLTVNAAKECLEEAGLLVKIVGHVIDVQRSTSVTRYYLARRIGGNPADMGWESEKVSLVPISQLHKFLNNSNDHPIIKALS